MEPNTLPQQYLDTSHLLIPIKTRDVINPAEKTRIYVQVFDGSKNVVQYCFAMCTNRLAQHSLSESMCVGVHLIVPVSHVSRPSSWYVAPDFGLSALSPA